MIEQERSRVGVRWFTSLAAPDLSLPARALDDTHFAQVVHVRQPVTAVVDVIHCTGHVDLLTCRACR